MKKKYSQQHLPEDETQGYVLQWRQLAKGQKTSCKQNCNIHSCVTTAMEESLRSASKKLPPDQAQLPTNHKMQIHRKLQVNLLLGPPSFQKPPTTKASPAPDKPLKIPLHYLTPLPSFTKAENKQEKTQETSQAGKHGKCT